MVPAGQDVDAVMGYNGTVLPLALSRLQMPRQGRIPLLH